MEVPYYIAREGVFNMFNLFGFIMPLFAQSDSGSLNPLAWLKDFWSDFSQDIQNWFGFIVEQVKSFIRKIIDSISNLWSSLSDYLGSICDWFFGVFESFSSWFGEALEWLAGAFNACLEYIGHCIEYCWEGFWYCIYYLLEWVYENFLYLLDWFVEWMMLMIDYLFEQIPEIAMPGGFETAVPVFIKFSMLLNECIPVKEAFALFALYLLVFCAVMIYRFIKSWIPFV